MSLTKHKSDCQCYFCRDEKEDKEKSMEAKKQKPKRKQRNHDFCDCKKSKIRWVDENNPHVALKQAGWFCMKCLQEFKPTSP
jgi:hypothetical protein